MQLTLLLVSFLSPNMPVVWQNSTLFLGFCTFIVETLSLVHTVGGAFATHNNGGWVHQTKRHLPNPSFKFDFHYIYPLVHLYHFCFEELTVIAVFLFRPCRRANMQSAWSRTCSGVPILSISLSIACGQGSSAVLGVRVQPSPAHPPPTLPPSQP